MIRKDPLSSYEDGAAAYNRADYATARRLWLPLAEAGNAEAQTMLGIIYEEGKGVSQDYAAAVTWYRRAADQGYPDAQFYLACMHDLGKGVPIDPAAAANWLTKAADQGHTDAQFSLGVMYEDGIGVSQDHQAAVGWYRKAAEQGHGKAQNNLGLMYENGTGVPQDEQAAMTWYRAAADQGHTAAEARVQQTQQCATGEVEQKQQEEEKPLKLGGGIEFAGAFQKLLREVAASAPGALHRDPVSASTEFSSLYSQAEIVSGISAAEDAGLSVEQGVICFVMLSAAIEAALQKHGGLLQQLKNKLTPGQGARARTHSVMFNYVCKRPPGGRMPKLETFHVFARRYNAHLAPNAKTSTQSGIADRRAGA